jgi:YHS domain-containing protein
MAKVTIVLCDVKPCTCQAEREFELNGQTFYVCGQQCFARFWSKEYDNWKESRYRMQVNHHHTPMREYETQEISERKNGSDILRSDLQIVKPRQG